MNTAIRSLVLFATPCLLLLSAHAQAPQSSSPESNIGHFQIGPFEFYAEERLDTAPDAKPTGRNKIWILPSLIVLPETVEVFDSSANLYDPSNPEQNETPTSSGKVSATSTKAPTPTAPPSTPKYLGRLVVKMNPPTADPLAKALIIAHLRNDPALRSVAQNNELFFRGLALGGGTTGPNDLTSPPLVDFFKSTDALASGYQIEVADPRQASITVSCAGQTIGSVSFPQGSSLSYTSTISIDCPDLDEATAKHFHAGRFSVTADMQVRLSNQQIATAEYDLNSFAEAISTELYDRVTEAKASKKGFLWWGSTKKSVESWITSSSTSSASGSTSMRSTLFLRDVSNQRLLDAATSFIFKPFETATNQRLTIMANDHRRAALRADERQQAELAEAHRKYADLLDTMARGEENADTATKAMEVIEKIFSGSGGGQGTSGNQGAGAGMTAAAASSGNPYVAAAMFIAQGIVYKKDSTDDKLHVAQTRKGVWSEQDNKYFSGMIVNQVNAGYSITQSWFPELEFYRSEIAKSKDNGTEGEDKAIERISIFKKLMLKPTPAE